MESRSRLSRLVLALGLALGASSQAHATVFCVDTGAELESAIETAATNGVDDVIKIASVTITGSSNSMFAPRWPYVAAASDEDTSIEISGGWTPVATCDNQSALPDDTVLDAEFKGTALQFLPAALPYSGKITVRNLLITRGYQAINEGAAVLYQGGGSGSSFRMERVVVVASKAEGTSRSIVRLGATGGGQIHMLNNAVFANTMATSQGSVVIVNCENNAICYANNNSIYENEAKDNANHYGLLLGGLVNASNNAVAGNTVLQNISIGKQAGGVSQNLISLRNNHFETEGFGTVFVETGTTTGNPKWTKSYNYVYPNPDSPLLNSGLNNPPGGVTAIDIDADPRLQQGTIERGAIEMPTASNEPPVLVVNASVTIPENFPLNTVVFTAYVTDDGKPLSPNFGLQAITCVPGGCGQPFYIDNSGRVRLNSPIPDGVSSYQMTVTVSDGQYSDTANVTVNINQAPTLGDSAIALANSTAVGTKVWTFAAAHDGKPSAILTYTLQSLVVSPAGAPDPFSLNSSNGDFTLTQALPAQATKYTYTIRVCDATPLCDTGTLVVDSVPALPPPPVQGAVFGNGFE